MISGNKATLFVGKSLVVTGRIVRFGSNSNSRAMLGFAPQGAYEPLL